MTPADLSDRQEEVLSYLQGLAPVGEPFEFETTVVATDLRISRGTVNAAIKGLIRRGYVELIGRDGSYHEYRVLKRLEARI